MPVFNRIVNVLTLIFAIASLTFGAILFVKRDQLRDRGDKMAAAIRKVSETLDDGGKSDTDFAAKLQTKRLPLVPDPKTGVTEAEAEANAAKTLYHDNYNTKTWLDTKKGVPPGTENHGQNLQRVLAPFLVQASDIITQRNALGATLVDIAANLEIPETFEPKEFWSVKTYVEKDTLLKEFAGKVTQRRNDVAEQIMKAGAAIHKPLPPDFGEKLKKLEFEAFKQDLSMFVDNADKLKRRSDSYAQKIAQLLRIMEIRTPDSSAIEGEDYPAALNAAVAAMQEEKDKFERTKKELADTKQELQDTRDQLAAREKDLREKTAECAAKQKEILKLRAMLFGGDQEKGAVVGDADLMRKEMESKLVGKVIEVNDKWDYVVINLGKNNIVRKKMANGKYSDQKIALPDDKLMYVSRDGQYIAKIKVTKVNDDCAVADITSDPRNGQIAVGDTVFFPPPPKRVKVDAAGGAGAAN